MTHRSPNPETDSSCARAALALAYRCAADVRRDRLADFPRGILARTREPPLPGDEVDVRILLEREKVTASALGVVRWVTQFAEESMVALEIWGIEHRDDVKLDLMLGIRSAGPAESEQRAARPRAAAQALTVTMLEPDPVLGQVIANALQRFAKEKEGFGELQLETVADAPSFVAAVAAHRPGLAVIDCDALPGGADPLVAAIRSLEQSKRVPLILLSDARAPRLEDPSAVTMQKPVGMKAFLHTADLLLRS